MTKHARQPGNCAATVVSTSRPSLGGGAQAGEEEGERHPERDRARKAGSVAVVRIVLERVLGEPVGPRGQVEDPRHEDAAGGASKERTPAGQLVDQQARRAKERQEEEEEADADHRSHHVIVARRHALSIAVKFAVDHLKSSCSLESHVRIGPRGVPKDVIHDPIRSERDEERDDAQAESENQHDQNDDENAASTDETHFLARILC
eukprot:CAMPEP_0183331788 /NCGR_PEP_ID=MMETSP0164_2-20130417/1111_1 /TAXON_ID=221442 /ORGANISM="Coccolithus pelagicus ssp braarudi, Strain PLY182g" /LENGTH=205 /DNA_ID=CAMNT_0025500365 /DNA_START=478 /DNA_END=1096 /DNA_ORIENTATION=-